MTFRELCVHFEVNKLQGSFICLLFRLIHVTVSITIKKKLGLGRDTVADVVKEAASAVVTIHVIYLGIACFCRCFVYREKNELSWLFTDFFLYLQDQVEKEQMELVLVSLSMRMASF